MMPQRKGQGFNAHMPQMLSSKDLDKWALDILDRMILMLSHEHEIVNQDGTIDTKAQGASASS